MTSTLFTNVRVLNADGLSLPRSVRIDGAYIGDVEQPSQETIDGTGHVLIPGLIDSHIHLSEGSAEVRALARAGVTTALDMGSWPPSIVEDVRRRGEGADIRTATLPAVGPGGGHARLPGFPAEAVITSPDQAELFVERRINDGADFIKMIAEAAPPEGMSQAAASELVRRAHDRGLLVIAHAISVGAVHVAVEAGADVITHAPLDAVLDDETVTIMRQQGTVAVPTLVMMKGSAVGRAGARYEHARDTVAKFRDAGIAILAGTDANALPGVPYHPAHGVSLHEELRLLTDASLTPMEALRSATTAPAIAFSLADRGTVEPGKRADLVLLRDDPTADITRSETVVGVWTAGRRAF